MQLYAVIAGLFCADGSGHICCLHRMDLLQGHRARDAVPRGYGRGTDGFADRRICHVPRMVQLDQGDDAVLPAGFRHQPVFFDLCVVIKADMVFAEASVRRHRSRFHTEEADAVLRAVDVMRNVAVA